jgi:hypothetical protein
MALRKRIDRKQFLRVTVAVLGLLFAGLTDTQGQTAPPQLGQNAVMNSATTATNSPAFVDAKSYYSTDICSAIANILSSPSNWNPNNSNGIVIDARGIGPGTTLTCSVNPWVNWSGEFNTTVLLPSATIAIQQTWIVPPSTRLVGAGSGLTSSTGGITTLKACTTSIGCGSAFAAGDMIEMGTAKGGWSWCNNYDCQAVVIEHLQLDGGSLSGVNGIYNQLSQELSYVNDIKLTNFAGTGLTLMGGTLNTRSVGPANSGPYTRIYYSGTGTCANLSVIFDTRGVHGLDCITTANPVIYLDATNESIEDVTIQATASSASQDGVLIGSVAAAQSNVLFNITGSGSGLKNLIHISSAATSGVPNAADLTIMGVTNSASSATSIKDDLTSSTLSDTNVGVYALGETLGSTSGGFSRFTTSPNVPTWLVGASTPSTPCSAGSLYSCTGSSCTKTLWACTSTGGSGSTWVGLK